MFKLCRHAVKLRKLCEVNALVDSIAMAMDEDVVAYRTD